MLHIGCHLSSAKGYEAMGRVALSIGANTFQFFSRNPRGSKAKAIDEPDIARFLKLAEDNGFGTLLAHAPYTLNPCSADPKVTRFAAQVLREDLELMEYLPGNLYNFHPGSHVGQGVEKGIELVADQLNGVLAPDQKTTVLLETMSGKGSELGKTFEELAAIIERVDLKEKLGVCLDTCHVYSAGYDIVNNLDAVLEQFDSVLGLERLHAIHLNDSMTPFSSFKDRHETIGKGSLGEQAFINIINHPFPPGSALFPGNAPGRRRARRRNSVAERTLPRLTCPNGSPVPSGSQPFFRRKSLHPPRIRYTQGL